MQRKYTDREMTSQLEIPNSTEVRSYLEREVRVQLAGDRLQRASV